MIVQMKITILDIKPGEEEEIIIKCNHVDDDWLRLLHQFRDGNGKLNAHKDGEIHILETTDVYYFEAVEQKVFAYCEKEVYEIKNRLYELTELLPVRHFLRISKSTILNIDKVKQLKPAFNGRFEAWLQNGEKVIISRQYVPDFKERLGL